MVSTQHLNVHQKYRMVLAKLKVNIVSQIKASGMLVNVAKALPSKQTMSHNVDSRQIV